MKELNEKLAKWAGLKNAKVYEDIIVYTGIINRQEWDNLYTDCFTESLDACFKWLVPKLQDRGNNIELYAYEHKGYQATVYKDSFTRNPDGFEPFLEPISQIRDDDPALALCKAIEKLIDGEKDE